MASFAQLERAIAKERQAEGIRAAKTRGVCTGRARKLTAEDLANAREWIGSGVPKAQVAHRLGIDLSTRYRALPLTAVQTTSDARADDFGRPWSRLRTLTGMNWSDTWRVCGHGPGEQSRPQLSHLS